MINLIFKLLFLSCQESLDEITHLPEHSECQVDPMPDTICQEVVEEDPRQPTTSINQSDMPPIPDDPRLTDEDYMWLTDQIKKCTCVCCHSTNLQGPGTYFWDIDFDPIWIDSANSWSLIVLAGKTEEPDQTLPSEDPERVVEIIDREISRRTSPNTNGESQ
jgi:hypothetical protein